MFGKGAGGVLVPKETAVPVVRTMDVEILVDGGKTVVLVGTSFPTERNAVYSSDSIVPKIWPTDREQTPRLEMYAPVHPKKPSQAVRHS